LTPAAARGDPPAMHTHDPDDPPGPGPAGPFFVTASAVHWRMEHPTREMRRDLGDRPDFGAVLGWLVDAGASAKRKPHLERSRADADRPLQVWRTSSRWGRLYLVVDPGPPQGDLPAVIAALVRLDEMR